MRTRQGPFTFLGMMIGVMALILGATPAGPPWKTHTSYALAYSSVVTGSGNRTGYAGDK